MRNATPEYQYFGQFQVNSNGRTVIGVELLLRELVAGQWQVPTDFCSIPDAVTLELIAGAIAKLQHKVTAVAINLCSAQLQNETLMAGVIELQQRAWPLQLKIEITDVPQFTPELVMRIVGVFATMHHVGIEISLDNVGQGSRGFAAVRELLPYVKEFKFALHSYRNVHKQMMVLDELSFWVMLARENRSRIVMLGVETSSDVQLGSQMGVDYFQGFFYGKPEAL